MPTSYTSLLGLALPVTGELSGTWGDTVNDYISQYVDAAVAGTQTISGSQTAVTLSKTTGSSLSQAGSGATGSSQYQIINCTGNPAGLLTVTVPAASRAYLVLNNTSTSQSVKIVGVGPTTGITVATAQAALVAWNGSDFELVASTDITTLSGTLPVSKGGTGATTLTANNVILGNGTSAVQFVAPGTNGNVLTSNGTTWTSAASTGASLSANNAFTGANTFYNATGQTFGTATSTQDGIILAGRAGGSSSYRVTLQPTTLTASRTLTLPNVTDTVATIGTAQTFTAAQTFRAASAIRSEAASTQDAVVVAGRAGGTSSYAVTLTPTTLSASRTLTLPDATTTVTGTDATQTLTNKRIDPRVSSTASASSVTPDVASFDMYAYTALAAALTINAPTGTPVNGTKLMFRILDNGTSQTLSWNATYTAIGVTLPTATTINKTTYVGCVYNAGSTRWDVIAVTTQA